ncbi:MAG: hypothetical protein R3B53_00350 [Candidatus Paceibacterota bacterium]
MDSEVKTNDGISFKINRDSDGQVVGITLSASGPGWRCEPVSFCSSFASAFRRGRLHLIFYFKEGSSYFDGVQEYDCKKGEGAICLFNCLLLDRESDPALMGRDEYYERSRRFFSVPAEDLLGIESLLNNIRGLYERTDITFSVVDGKIVVRCVFGKE